MLPDDPRPRLLLVPSGLAAAGVLALLAAFHPAVPDSPLGYGLLLAAAVALGAWGAAFRSPTALWASAGGVAGLGWLAGLSFGILLLALALVIAVFAARAVGADGRRLPAPALAAAALALTASMALVLDLNLADAYLDPCMTVRWDAPAESGVRTVSPSDPCASGGGEYRTSMYLLVAVGVTAPLVALFGWWAARRGMRTGVAAATLVMLVVAFRGVGGGQDASFFAPALVVAAAVLAVAAARTRPSPGYAI